MQSLWVLWWVYNEVGPILRMKVPEQAEIEFGSLTSMLVIVMIVPYAHLLVIFESLGFHKRFTKNWGTFKHSVIPTALFILGSGFVLHHLVERQLLELGYSPCEARTFRGRYGSSQVYMPAPLPEECWN